MLALAAMLPGEPALAQGGHCQVTLAGAGLKANFGGYRVPVSSGRPARVQLRTARDRAYRSRLRWTAQNGPVFAGHYTIGVWGCGAGCRQLAIVDIRSGRVHWDPALNYYSADISGDDPDTYQFALTFRPESRLLVFAGLPLKDMGGTPDLAHAGVSLYEWRGDRLHLLRFVPATRLCPRGIYGD